MAWSWYSLISYYWHKGVNREDYTVANLPSDMGHAGHG